MALWTKTAAVTQGASKEVVVAPSPSLPAAEANDAKRNRFCVVALVRSLMAPKRADGPKRVES